MTSGQRRVLEAQSLKPSERSETVRTAFGYLAAAGPTATRATLILPTGETIYLAADDARAMAWGKLQPRRAMRSAPLLPGREAAAP
jgi:hypothetical protein